MSAVGTFMPTRTFGKYRLVRQLGTGGMGVVDEANDVVLHRKVAVKVLLSRPEASDALLERFRREARAAARLSHPHVVPVYDVGTDPNAFIVMEYLPGGNVHQLVQAAGRLSWEKAVALIIQAGKGLAAAHAAGDLGLLDDVVPLLPDDWRQRGDLLDLVS